VLATGGFSRHPALRQVLLPEPVPDHSPVVESVTGGSRTSLAVPGCQMDRGGDAQAERYH
jgi:hypothetical protein